MAIKVAVSEEDIVWLEQALEDGISYREMSVYMGCCVDTLKRILMRHDLAYFDAAKYVTSTTSNVQMWDRPCSICKDTTPRPKWQYRCNDCTAKQSNDDYDDPHLLTGY